MALTKTYTNAITLTEDQWKYFTVAQKEKLLEAMNMSTSWAETKTIEEMVKRGGGMVARQLKNINQKYLAENNGSVTITYEDAKC